MPNYNNLTATSDFNALRSTNPSTDLQLITGEVFTQSVQNSMVEVEEVIDNYLANTVQPAIGDGWYAIDTNETWSFGSNSGFRSVINVPSNATQRYQKGDKVRFVQSGTTRHGTIVEDPTTTTITIFGDAVTNVAISNIFISRVERPFGFNRYLTERIRTRASRQINQNISGTGGWQVLVFNDAANSINYDISSCYNTNTGYFTYPVTGYYNVMYAVYFANGSSTDCYVRVNNNTNIEREHIFPNSLSTTYFQQSSAQVVRGVAGGSLAIEVTVGVNRTIASGIFNTFMIVNFESF